MDVNSTEVAVTRRRQRLWRADQGAIIVCTAVKDDAAAGGWSRRGFARLRAAPRRTAPQRSAQRGSARSLTCDLDRGAAAEREQQLHRVLVALALHAHQAEPRFLVQSLRIEHLQHTAVAGGVALARE